MSAPLRTLAIVASGLSLALPALGQELGDPTRPPAVATPAVAARAEAPAAAPFRLESILISPGRRVAVINGHTLGVGGKVVDAVVVAIAETHVTLRTGGTLTKVELYAGIQRKPVLVDKKKEPQP